jgi:hypothetical protein
LQVDVLPDWIKDGKEDENIRHLVLFENISQIDIKEDSWEVENGNQTVNIPYSSATESLDIIYRFREENSTFSLEITASATGWVRAFNITIANQGKQSRMLILN